ncbi:MAG: endonuclease/exonuclease/phosphatase family protein [Sphingomonadaceae bacterium]|nr:endonuclease/exonuclease/phosphatase family protein [Sphingomonadaceae bacterium]
MQLTFASYNIRKAIGLDGRRDPERILSILREVDADVVALQEVDRRLGRRASALPLAMILENTHYRPVCVSMRPESLGWHGNALLVKRGLEIADAAPMPLPVLEPRGAIRGDLVKDGRRISVVGMHLDLSGLRRRRQVQTILSQLADRADHVPTVMLGDFNQWGTCTGAMREFGSEWHALSPGRSFPSPRPVARLDRVVASREWEVLGAGVHHSALAARGSDHLPIWAELRLPII